MKHLNRLAQASSPYLLQHATNPVDWYEWGEEALQLAKTTNKPLIISIGYAACHWCHVMAHESFEDENIAAYMNKNFVCIKVDREERPDIDQIYMDAAHIVTGRGGWPLNAVALPDGRPFYAATYFPPQQWVDVLQQLKEVFDTDYQRVLNAADSITNGINATSISTINNEKDFSREDYRTSFENHIKNIDHEQGGYRKAPKFMMPIGLEFLLQYHYFTGQPKALKAVTTALDAMARGGLNDQLGGGFARYSTDERWLVPHFEKMLYDNAQLISLYAKAYQVTKNPFYKETIEKTIAFCERELLDKSGGFYSSLDADSEHEEGKFYVFTKEEIRSVLDQPVTEIISEFYNITSSGNWEHGKNILHFTTEKSAFAQKHGMKADEFEQMLDKANQQLFNYRSQRIRPGTDDKILCAWNALMITAYCDAFKATGNDAYRAAAIKTADFINQDLLKSDNRLFRVYKSGKTSVDGFLDDYALLAAAFISIYEISFEIKWLASASQLVNHVLNHFANTDQTVFYYTADYSENLIARKTEYSDNVIPASASVLAHVFYQLGTYFENDKWTDTSKTMLSKVLDETVEYGVYYANWARLLGKFVLPHVELTIAGKDALKIALPFQLHYRPDTIIAGGNEENIPSLKSRLENDKTLIYVCRDKVCQLPTEEVGKAFELLNSAV